MFTDSAENANTKVDRDPGFAEIERLKWMYQF
jgi:hypothetical protein